GAGSASTSGWPADIFVMLAGGWKSSASRKLQPSAAARARPTVVLPQPATPMSKITISGRRLFQPRLLGDGIAAFVKINVVEHRHDGFCLEAALGDALAEAPTGLVAPAALHHETIPNVALLVGARAAALVAPREELLVVNAAVQHARLQFGETHPQKSTAARVEHARFAVAEIRDVVRRKFSSGVEPDFVEHAAEIDQAADFGVGTAETGDVGHADNRNNNPLRENPKLRAPRAAKYTQIGRAT